MKLTRSADGQIIVTRRTRNGSQETIGKLSTSIPLAEAKAKYHAKLEQMEAFYNSQPNARHELREAVSRFDRDVVQMDLA